MKTPKLVQQVMKAEYAVVRTPLGLVESRVVTKLPARSRLRAGVERSLGSIDVLAGRALGDQEVVRRGAELSGRATQRRRSADLADEAVALRNRAAEVAETGQAEAAARRQLAAEQEQADVSAALNREREAQQRAADEADAEAAAGTRAAAQRAEQRTQRARAKRSAGQQRLDAKVTQAAKATSQELRDAAEERSEAAERRQDAAMLAELADAEKQKRRSRRRDR